MQHEYNKTKQLMYSIDGPDVSMKQNILNAVLIHAVYMAFTDPMHRNKCDINDLLTYLHFTQHGVYYYYSRSVLYSPMSL